MTRKTVKRVKTGAFERRFSMARAGIIAGAKYATRTAGTFLAPAEEREGKRREILSKQAQELVSELGKLKGSVVKIGQMMALMGEHFLPQEVTDALHTLENDTTALAWTTMERHIWKELGDSRFMELEIDPEPLGAASLAQVHRARVRDTDLEVVLKVQYPGVAEAIESDLRALVQLLRISRLVPITEQFNEWLGEVRDMLRREVNYALEADTTRHFQQVLADDSQFVVPTIIDRYCTDTLLCMTYESGVHISDPSVTELSQSRRNFLGKAIMQLCCREVFEWNKMQTDPNFGNYLMRVDPHGNDDKIVLLDFGAFRDFDNRILAPGREMIRGAYHHDSQRVIDAFRALNFLADDVPSALLDGFVAICFEAVEVLQDPDKYPPPDNVLNERGEYLWGESDLPTRIVTMAGKNALSVHFDVPPKEFIFLARKLLGAYTFLHVIRAEVRGNTILEPFLPLNETTDQALVVAHKIASGG